MYAALDIAVGAYRSAIGKSLLEIVVTVYLNDVLEQINFYNYNYTRQPRIKRVQYSLSY